MISSIFLFLSQLLCFCFSHTPFHQTDPLIRDCGKDFCIHRGKFSTGFLLICLFCAHVSTAIIFLVVNNNFYANDTQLFFSFPFFKHSLMLLWSGPPAGDLPCTSSSVLTRLSSSSFTDKQVFALYHCLYHHSAACQDLQESGCDSWELSRIKKKSLKKIRLEDFL